MHGARLRSPRSNPFAPAACNRRRGDSRQGAATPTYVVECYWPEITEQQARDALASVTQSQEASGTSGQVQPIACFLIPSDGMALFLLDGPSADMVREAGKLTNLPFDRIVESFPILLRSGAFET